MRPQVTWMWIHPAQGLVASSSAYGNGSLRLAQRTERTEHCHEIKAVSGPVLFLLCFYFALCFYGPQVQARKWRKQEAVALSLADFCLRELEGRPAVSTPVDILYVLPPSGGWTIGYR